MRLLLDTHIALWWLSEPERLTAGARTALESPDNEVYMSAVSVWEAGVKEAVGRLRVDLPLVPAARDAGVLELPVTWGHARGAALLPLLHRDPFDRLLVAQAASEALVLMTRDRILGDYDVTTMPA